jgi:hypothetical protein
LVYAATVKKDDENRRREGIKSPRMGRPFIQRITISSNHSR